MRAEVIVMFLQFFFSSFFLCTFLNGEPVRIKSRDECVIFPFAPQICSLLMQHDLYEAMEHFRCVGPTQSKPDGRIRSHFDGHEWRTHPFFEQHRGAYSILWYCDEITVTNPIGQFKRKIMQYYFSVLDLGPSYSGKDATIFVALMAWDDHVKKRDYHLKMFSHPMSIGAQLPLFQREEGVNVMTAYGVRKVLCSRCCCCCCCR
jgi:hypothetical protein